MMSMRKGAVITILLLVVSAASTHGAEPGKFVNLGPGGGGGIFNANGSPHDPKLCFVWCDMSGFYRSADGGRSWTMLDKTQMRSGHKCRTLFHPTDPNVVYGVSRGMLRVSRDKGQTWKPLADERPWQREIVTELGIDRRKTNRMFLGSNAAAYASTDGGRTWKKVEQVTGATVGFFSNGPSFIATADGVFRSDDAGRTWSKRNNGLPWTGLRDFCGATDRRTDRTVLFCAIPSKKVNDKFTGGIYRSEDLGESWQSAMGKGLNTTLGKQLYGRSDIAQYLHVGMAETNLDVVWCTTRGTGYLPPYHWTVYRSTDRGKTWKATYYWDSRGKAKDNVEPTWLALDFTWGWGGPPLTFSVNPGNPDQAFYTNTGELFITDDGGRSWFNGTSRPLKGKFVKGAAWVTTGLEVTVPHDLVVDPFDKNKIHGGWSDIGYLRSEDGGKSWTLSSAGSPWRNTFYEILPDPARRDTIYAAASNHHGIPAWSYIGVERRSSGGVVLSTNGGKSWRNISNGIPNTAVTSLCMDPASPPTSRILWAAAFRSGVYKSTDGGKTWQLKSNGLPADNTHVYMIRRHPDGTLFVSTTGKRSGLNFLAPSGLYKSTDGGESWSSITRSLALRWINGFELDPRDSKVAYLTCSAIPRGHDGGIHKTADGGKTWQDITPKYDKAWQGYMHAYAVLLDPKRPDRVYFSTGTHGLFMSRDAGETWKPVNGIPFNGILKTVLDPHEKGVIWVLTYGGGLWRGRAGD